MTIKWELFIAACCGLAVIFSSPICAQDSSQFNPESAIQYIRDQGGKADLETNSEKYEKGSFYQIDICNLVITDELLDAISHVPGPISLKCGFTSLTDKQFAQLKNRSRIIALIASHTQIGDPSMCLLRDCLDLRAIGIESTNVTPNGLEQLSRCRSLQIVAVDGFELSSSMLTWIGLQDHLRKLRLSRCTFAGDAGLAPLYMLKNIEQLVVDSLSLRPQDFDWMASLSKLDLLVLSNARFDHGEVGKLSSLPHLTALYLANTPLRPGDLITICESNLALELIDCSGTEIGPVDIKAIATLPRLMGLCLCDMKQLTGDDLECLGGNRVFGILALRNMNLTDDQLQHLSKIRDVAVLDLSGNPLTSSGIQFIAKWRSLHSLELKDTNVDNQAIETFKQLTKLECLSLSKTRVTEEGIAHIRQTANLKTLNYK